MERERSVKVQQIMQQFAEDTGLRGGKAPSRYLWTDAFAVCNYLEMYRQTGEDEWKDLALALVEQTHRVLGRHRPDSGREGWISGLPEAEGKAHPTSGGLRIGKSLPERFPGEPLDERLEWDRDGQYYHYLTKWMHALNRVSRTTGDVTFLRWGIELARAAHRAFSYRPPWGGPKRLYWKMSVDLSRPQVPSMGAHDPLDGLVTVWELECASRETDPAGRHDLTEAGAELLDMCRGRDWGTSDPLGIGGLLCDAWRIAQLVRRGEPVAVKLLGRVLSGAGQGLEQSAAGGLLELPPHYRLPFRELGLAIGLHAVEELLKEARTGQVPGSQGGADLGEYVYLAEELERYWQGEGNRCGDTWQEHREINSVMLATSLAPGEFLRV